VLKIIAATVVTAIARYLTGPVGAVRPRTEICDVGPERIDAGQTQSHVIVRQAKPARTLQVAMILVSLWTTMMLRG
jgi:hypothetical protein